MATILHTTFSDVFSWMQMFEFQIKFDWDLFLGGVIDNKP